MQKEEKDPRDRTKAFALRIVRMFSALRKTTDAQVLGKQLLRGNFNRCQLPRGVASAKQSRVHREMWDSLREIEESAYWMELLVESGVVSVEKLAPLR